MFQHCFHSKSKGRRGWLYSRNDDRITIENICVYCWELSDINNLIYRYFHFHLKNQKLFYYIWNLLNLFYPKESNNNPTALVFGHENSVKTIDTYFCFFYYLFLLLRALYYKINRKLCQKLILLHKFLKSSACVRENDYVTYIFLCCTRAPKIQADLWTAMFAPSYSHASL